MPPRDGGFGPRLVIAGRGRLHTFARGSQALPRPDGFICSDLIQVSWGKGAIR
jgi:hypothetical protein